MCCASSRTIITRATVQGPGGKSVMALTVDSPGLAQSCDKCPFPAPYTGLTPRQPKNPTKKAQAPRTGTEMHFTAPNSFKRGLNPAPQGPR
jgi:hypothetical protein